jgi:methyltransferase family protein
MVANELMSEEYRRLNCLLHAADPEYGKTASRYIAQVRDIARKFGVRTLLDYGCGKGVVRRSLMGEFEIRGYDPAITGLDQVPTPAEMIVCIDVLEHVEPDCLNSVLAHIAGLMQRIGLITIATQASSKRLPDGTNCHRIVEDCEWWIARLSEHVSMLESRREIGSLWCLVEPLKIYQ